MLSKQLQDQIEQEARAYANQFKYGAEYRKPAFADGANEYATLYEIAISRAERAERVLQQIRNWELPNTGQFWDKERTRPMSYKTCYGSNGVRDYFRNLANFVLNGTAIAIHQKTNDNDPKTTP